MRITVRDIGASGAHGPRANPPSVRFGITRSGVVDDGSPGMLTIELPDKAEREQLARLFCYAAGFPDFTDAEWRLIMEATRAHAVAGHALDDALENIASEIARKRGWPNR